LPNTAAVTEVEEDTAGAVASTVAVGTPADTTVGDMPVGTTVVGTPVACMVDHKLCPAAVTQG